MSDVEKENKRIKPEIGSMVQVNRVCEYSIALSGKLTGMVVGYDTKYKQPCCKIKWAGVVDANDQPSKVHNLTTELVPVEHFNKECVNDASTGWTFFYSIISS